MATYLLKHKFLQIFGVFCMALALAGCSSKSWDWFYNDQGDDELEEIVIDEEPVEEIIEIDETEVQNAMGENEIIEEVVYVYVDEDGNELYREIASTDQVQSNNTQGTRESRDRMPSTSRSQGRYSKPKYGDEPALANRRSPPQEAGRLAADLPDNIILFPYKKTRPDTRGMRLLEKHAERLRDNPDLIVTVEGHTDSVASHEYNKKLGLKRARVVAEILEEMGVNPNQLVTVSYGKERPLRRGNDPQTQALNRRVEIVY